MGVSDRHHFAWLREAIERFERETGCLAQRAVTPGSYLDELRKDLAIGRKHLIEPALMEEHFKVLYRDARYFYRATKKFNLYLLTVLEPVGK